MCEGGVDVWRGPVCVCSEGSRGGVDVRMLRGEVDVCVVCEG